MKGAAAHVHITGHEQFFQFIDLPFQFIHCGSCHCDQQVQVIKVLVVAQPFLQEVAASDSTVQIVKVRVGIAGVLDLTAVDTELLSKPLHHAGLRLAADEHKYLSISLEKAEHLEDLINEFFEITRFNLSNITLEYSRVNLTRMLEQLIYEFKPMLLEKNLKCELEIAPDTMIKCDVNKMQRVFDNLLRNAVNYSFDDSTIHIAVKQNGENLCIQFTNCGNTIPKEKLVRIFEQFYRLDVARSSRSGGAGLGLAVAKEIVELHNGTITAKSENEQIEFTVTLPLL